jgi:hypothetical protein
MSSMMKCTAENLTVLLCWLLANDTHTQIYLAFLGGCLEQAKGGMFFSSVLANDRCSFFLDHGMINKEQRFNKLNQISSHKRRRH